MSVIRSQVLGCGAFLPAKVLSNAQLAKMVDTSDEWIRARTGIERRHIAEKGETTSDLAFHAAQAALKNANVGVDELDLIIVATTTPDETFPSVATKIQARLGMTRGAAFDTATADLSSAFSAASVQFGADGPAGAGQVTWSYALALGTAAATTAFKMKSLKVSLPSPDFSR